MDPNIRQSWEDFLNPEQMRTHPISASIYIAGFESLKDAIISRARELFVSGWSKEESDLVDPKYEAEVLSRNRSPVYASLDWLREQGAITYADIAGFDRVKTCRNHLAHRLLQFLGTEGMPPILRSALRRRLNYCIR